MGFLWFAVFTAPREGFSCARLAANYLLEQSRANGAARFAQGSLGRTRSAWVSEGWKGLPGTRRRKFRSQTSDNMDKWKAEVGRVREEKRRRKKIKKEKVSEERRSRRAKAGSAGSKSRLATAAGAEPAGQMRDEQLHAAVARRCAKHMSKSKCTKHIIVGPLLEVEMSKKCTPLWREAHFQVKMLKTPGDWTTFGSWDVEKVHAVVVRSTFRSQNCKKNWGIRSSFWRSDAVLRGRCKGFCTLPKVSKTWGFCSISKNHGRRGICKDAYSVAGAVQETCSSDLLGGLGADFLRRVAFWSIRSSGLLRWFCVTGAALRMTRYHFFVAGAVV